MSHPPIRRLILGASALAMLLLAPNAHAEVPSVDAYGGEALVLGTPHHRGGGTTPRSGASGGSGGSGESSASSGTSHSSTGGAGSSAGGLGGSGSTGSGTSTHTGNGGGGDSGTQQSKTPGSGGNANQGSTSKANPPTIAGDTSSGSSTGAFDAGDILLILVGLLCVAGVGVVLRVARKPAGDAP